MSSVEYKARNGVTSGGATTITAAAQSLSVDVSDLENVTALAIQAVDAGTVTAVLEKSMDGVLFVPFGAGLTEASWAAGNNTAVERSLSDANGMPVHCKVIRLTASALAGGGTYKLQVSGRTRLGAGT